MKNTKIIITLMILAISVFSFAFVDTYDASRNVLDMINMVDYNGVYTNKSNIIRLTDETLHILREPTANNQYRYADWKKTYKSESSMTKMKVEFRQNKFQKIEKNFKNIHKVEISVPKKYGLFHGNDPIYVKNVVFTYTNLNNQRKTIRKTFDRWFNKGDDKSFNLPEIAATANIKLYAACQNGKKDDCAIYINVKKAELEDSVANPYREEVRKLKDLKDRVDTIRKDEALSILEAVYGKIDNNNQYAGGNDDELIDRLNDVKSQTYNDRYRAIRSLNEVIRNLQYENYDYRVVNKLKEAEDVLNRNYYGCERDARDIIDEVISDLKYNQGGYYSINDLVNSLSDIERDLPYYKDAALSKIRRLNDIVEYESIVDYNVKRELRDIEELVSRGGTYDLRRADDKVKELIEELDNPYNPNPTPVGNDVVSRLHQIKTNLPAKTNIALRLARRLREDLINQNYDSRVVRNLEKVIEYCEKGSHSDAMMAKDLLERMIKTIGGSTSNTNTNSTLVRELQEVKRYLPYNTTMAVRKVRQIKDSVYDNEIKTGLERAEYLLVKAGTDDVRQAIVIIDRLIQKLK